MFRIRDLGITPKVAEAVLAWSCRHGLDTDWTLNQLAGFGECSRSTISRAVPRLMESGLVEQVDPFVFTGFRKPENRCGTYRFTDKLYLMLAQSRRPSKARSGRSVCTTPLGFKDSIIQVPPPVQHHHQEPTPKCDADGVLGPSTGSLSGEETVQVLVQEAGLDLRGAISAAKGIPSTCPGSLLPYLARSVAEEVQRRQVSGTLRKTAQHLAQWLLRWKSQEFLSRARELQSRAHAVPAAVPQAGITPVMAKLGIERALKEVQDARTRAHQAGAGSAGALYLHDQVSKAEARLFAWVEAAAGPETVARWTTSVDRELEERGLQPGALIWKRAQHLGLKRERMRWIEEVLGWPTLETKESAAGRSPNGTGTHAPEGANRAWITRTRVSPSSAPGTWRTRPGSAAG